MKIITQMQAAKLGLNKFYTGRACVHGHISERWTLNGACIQCNIERIKRKREVIKEIRKSARAAEAAEVR